MTDLQYYVAFEAGTEKPFNNPYWDNKREGLYKTIALGEIVFSSRDKYKSGTGWPSFVKPVKLMNGEKNCVVETEDNTLFMSRTEVSCFTDGVHLGHVFDDGPKDRGGLRYCLNSAALTFVPKE